jgi:hypothetical protein
MSKRGDIRRRDQARFKYLAEHFIAADFEYETGDGKITALIIEMPRHAQIGADLRMTIDAALDARESTVTPTLRT